MSTHRFSPTVLAKAADCHVTPLGGHLYQIDSPSGTSYRVHTDGKQGVCDCPARTPRCAHLAAALLHVRAGRDQLVSGRAS